MPTPSSTASFTTPTASISPAKASGANAPDRSQKIDHQPPTLAQIYYQQSARQPGDIISERRATSSRNQRATSSESALPRLQRPGAGEPQAQTGQRHSLYRLEHRGPRAVGDRRGRPPAHR